LPVVTDNYDDDGDGNYRESYAKLILMIQKVDGIVNFHFLLLIDWINN